MAHESDHAAARLADLSRYLSDFDLRDRTGTSTLGAWFLGPKAENADLLMGLVERAVRAHCADRRGFYPDDPAYVTDGIKQSAEYRSSVDTLGRDLDVLLNALCGSIPFFSYRYQGHMNWDVTIPSVVGYLAGMLYNSNNVTPEASPVTTLLEMEVGKDLCRMLGFDPDAGPVRPWGHVTCDGTVANVEALWSARNMRYYPVAVATAIRRHGELSRARDMIVPLPGGGEGRLLELSVWQLLNLSVDVTLDLPQQMRRCGVTEGHLALITPYTVQQLGYVAFARTYLEPEGIGEPAVFVPATKHYSWPKAMALLGLGQQNLCQVEVDLDARASPLDRRQLLAAAIEHRRPIVLDVAVLGSTEESAVDPLASMLDIRDDLGQQHHVAYPVHVDGAWGGYFASLLRPAPPGAVGDGGRRATPEVTMSEYVIRQYECVRRADSVTIDPHKAGYVPYPAGGLCYRNGEQKALISFDAPYVRHDGDPGVGFFGVEGSKPGAPAAGVYLSHRVIPPDRSGYGKILGRSLFNSKRFYAALMTMATDDDPFIVIGHNRLPAERAPQVDPAAVAQQRRFIRERIVQRSNEELLADQEAMKLFRQLGSDQLITAYAFNFRLDGGLNEDIDAMNEFNHAIYQHFSMPAESVLPTGPLPPKDRPRLILTESRFEPESYGGDFLVNFQKRLGVRPDATKFVTFLRSTTMDPWLSDTERGDFVPELIRELREGLTELVPRMSLA